MQSINPRGLEANATASRRSVSDAALRAAKPTTRTYKISAGGGLYLEVAPSGSKLWRWKYRLHGKENRFALGAYPRISLKEAREAAENARKLVLQGQHPSKQKRIARLQAGYETSITLETMAAEWLALKGWEEITKRRRLTMLKRVVFPTLGNLPVSEISPPLVLDVLKAAARDNGPSVMAEAKRTLYGIFELAVETFRVPRNPVHQWREALPKNKTQHKRPLTKQEIGQLLRDVDNQRGSYQIQAAFLLMWLTLARPSEVVEAEWSEFDLDGTLWRIPAERMKMRREHTVPLPRQAVHILKVMYGVTGHRRHVFPHRDDRQKPMVAASFRQMLNVLGWSGKFSPHATRVTGSTRLNELGFSPDWIERQLAHAELNRVRSTYNQADYLSQRAKMMQNWADCLDAWKAAATSSICARA